MKFFLFDINWFVFWFIVYGNLLISQGYYYNVYDAHFHHPNGNTALVLGAPIVERENNKQRTDIRR